MSVELLKLLLALGTGALSALLAYISGWVPPEGTSPMTYAVITLVVAIIKRGLDWLAAKSATPKNPTATTYPRG